MTRNVEVANTIVEQLGGRKFLTMTGARNLTAIPDGLSFRLPNRFAKNGINAVKIILTPMDTYTVTFSRIFKVTLCSEISVHEDVYAEDLQGLFTSTTGLDTRLGGI
jgi:hypothetical protein